MTDLELARDLRAYVVAHWDSVPSWALNDIGDDGAGCLMVRAAKFTCTARRLNTLLAGREESDIACFYPTLTKLVFLKPREELLKALDRAISRLEEREAAPYQPPQEDPAPLTRRFFALHRAKTESAAPVGQLHEAASEV